MSNANAITSILERLKKLDGVQTSLIVDRDGLLIAEANNQEVYSTESLASLFARATYNYEKMSRDNVNPAYRGISQLTVERQGKEKLIMFVTPSFILALVTQGNVNLGLVSMEMRESIKQINPLLGT